MNKAEQQNILSTTLTLLSSGSGSTITKYQHSRKPCTLAATLISYMRRFITILLVVGFITSFRPGEPVATLTCKSESGRTTFTAVLPSCSYLEKAELIIDKSKLQFEAMDRSYIIFDPDNKVFTVFLESGSNDPKAHKFLKFWAVPSSFKKTKSEKGTGSEFHDTYQFHAKLYATEPRNISEPNTKTIELVCTLDYEL
jgi:hypothetical protein